MATYTLRYATTRQEIWRWYWRAWAGPAGFWRFHLFSGAVVALILTVLDRSPFNWSLLLVRIVVCTACLTVLLPLWPQIMFKPQVRTLEVDDSGFRTAVGRHRAARLWSEIRSLHDDGETIVLTGRNGNSMLIPRRAFEDAASRAIFLSDAKRWHAGVASNHQLSGRDM
jgi:hypothetical protein